MSTSILSPSGLASLMVLCLLFGGDVAYGQVGQENSSESLSTAEKVTRSTGSAPPGYAGSDSCRPCHAEQHRAWSASLHAAAMREAGARTRDLSGQKATFGKDAAASIEFGGKAEARTATAKEAGQSPATLDVRYALGRRPMEQYLVATDRGRLQALPVAYDTAKREWFDIFAGEERRPGDFGHWTGRGMNANSQCIACHTTAYRAGYDEKTDTYASFWAEIGVGCEACHGPGAAHAAEPEQRYGPFGAAAGIAAHKPKPGATVAEAAAAPAAAALMLDTCASCHSVRRPIAEGFSAGAALLDHFEPSLLDDGIYRADGSVQTEGYEWGSWLQSRMHDKGVNCLACHEVHSGELRADGNDLCLSCHESALATTSHTAHEAKSPGPGCIDCHMPGTVFMARDHRRDHALSVPDPLLASDLGVPSACEACHADRGRDTLAADAARLWPALQGERFATRRTVARAFADAGASRPSSADGLRECLSGRTCTSAILRASAARLTERVPPDSKLAGALLEALEDADPLVRSAAAYALADADPGELMTRQYLRAAVADPVRAVRINAAWALRRIDTDRLPPDQAEPIEKAFGEWRAATMLLADSPESWHTLGLFETARREPAAAEKAYRRAIAMEAGAIPSRYNLAMLLVDTGRIDEARKEFEALVAADDSQAAAWHALGLLHGEQKNWGEAARALGRCVNLDPAYPGVLPDLTHAYLEAGVPNVARAVLSGALDYPPTRREALAGLVAVALRSGDQGEAVKAAKALVAEDAAAASNPEIARLLADPAGAAKP